MINIQIDENLATGAGQPPEVAALLEKAAQQALARAGSHPTAELTLVLSDDAQLQALNRQYLEIDAPTDVLSFPAGEVDPDDDALYLGDVVISYPRAAAQAQATGHPVEAELQLLVVHGVLHLLGYDHADEPGKAAMWSLQAAILGDLGWANLSVP